MIDLRLSVNGTQQIEQTLHIAANNMSNFTGPLTDIKNAFIRYQRKEFESEGAYGGYKWAPLSTKYAAWKAKHFPGKRILEATGDLRKSLTSKLNAVVRPTKLILWSDSTIGGYHQDGDGNLPARKIIALKDTEEKKDWVRLLSRHIIAGQGGPGVDRGPSL